MDNKPLEVIGNFFLRAIARPTVLLLLYDRGPRNEVGGKRALTTIAIGGLNFLLAIWRERGGSSLGIDGPIFFTYWPSIQGFSDQFRTITSHRSKRGYTVFVIMFHEAREAF